MQLGQLVFLGYLKPIALYAWYAVFSCDAFQLFANTKPRNCSTTSLLGNCWISMLFWLLENIYTDYIVETNLQLAQRILCARTYRKSFHE